MSTVPNIKQKTKRFQIRWKEPLGMEGAPYAYRWVFIAFGYSIRIHKWLCTDGMVEKGGPHFHNHAWWFCTFVLKGGYKDVSLPEIYQNETAMKAIKEKRVEEDSIYLTEELKRFDFKYRPANHLHYVVPNKGGCTTLLITGRPISNWGFWINNRILRPLKYFHKFGSNVPCK